MKCHNCGQPNRDNVNFCENCGEPLAANQPSYCPNCGHANRAGVSFCEECGGALGAAPGVAAPPYNVPRQRRRRRLNPLLLLLFLLLLLVSCCCFLLVFDVVAAPVAAEPFLNPIIEPVRDIIQKIPILNQIKIGGDRGAVPQEPKEVITCEDFRDRLEAAELGQETTCPKDGNECWTDIHDINDLEDIGIVYSWDGGGQRTATCEQIEDFTRCYFPRDWEADRVDYWIILEDCKEKLGFSENWLPDGGAEEEGVEVVEVPPAPASCCLLTDIENVRYERPWENGPLLLKFELVCDDWWGIGADSCFEETARVYVRADFSELWTEVNCCLGSSNQRLFCESPGEVDQKVSRTKVVLENGDCTWEVEFHSPAYTTREPVEEEEESECPDGESMCAGSCCSIGHCCDCGSGLGCWSDCSGCS